MARSLPAGTASASCLFDSVEDKGMLLIRMVSNRRSQMTQISPCSTQIQAKQGGWTCARQRAPVREIRAGEPDASGEEVSSRGHARRLRVFAIKNRTVQTWLLSVSVLRALRALSMPSIPAYRVSMLRNECFCSYCSLLSKTGGAGKPAPENKSGLWHDIICRRPGQLRVSLCPDLLGSSQKTKSDRKPGHISDRQPDAGDLSPGIWPVAPHSGGSRLFHKARRNSSRYFAL
jgi:hypothetical protein